MRKMEQLGGTWAQLLQVDSVQTPEMTASALGPSAFPGATPPHTHTVTDKKGILPVQPGHASSCQ